MQESSLSELGVSYIYETMRGTLLMWLIFSLLCAPILASLVQNSSPAVVFVLLATLGWGVYYGQDLALSQMGRKEVSGDDLTEESLIDQISFFVGALLYHNIVVLVAGAFGYAFYIVGSTFMGFGFAFLYPIFDSETAERALPLSLGGVASAILVILSYLWTKHQDISWSSLRWTELSFDLLSEFQNLPRPR